MLSTFQRRCQVRYRAWTAEKEEPGHTVASGSVYTQVLTKEPPSEKQACQSYWERDADVSSSSVNSENVREDSDEAEEP